VNQYGNYKPTHELTTRGFTSTFMAERVAAGDGPPLAILKVLQLTGGPVEPENPEGLVVEFLDGARTQQRVANASEHWAKIYQTGLMPGGAFFVAEHFPRSVQRMLDMHARLDAGQLFGILGQVLAALADLRRISERPHGNIKPTNVLLRDNVRPGAPGSVVVTDPLPAAWVMPEHASDDLESLGRLLYQLVTHSPSATHIVYPIDDSHEWAELGRSGERLRELCNLLLDPEPSWYVKIERVQQELAGRQRVGKALRAAAVIAAVALISVPAIAYAVRHPSLFSFNRGSGDKISDNDRGKGKDKDDGTGNGTGTTTTRSLNTTTRNVNSGLNTVEPRSGDVVAGLMAAENRANPFKVTIDAAQDGEMIELTVTAEANCYLLIVCRDRDGDVTLLLPNARWPTAKRLDKGQTFRFSDLHVDNEKLVLPVQPPYGKLTFKAIATTRRVEFVGAAGGAMFLKGMSALALEGSPRSATTLAKLLGQDEWATAQAEIVTRPPGGAAADGGTGGGNTRSSHSIGGAVTAFGGDH
jgi:hypothetical protein